jgi:hypothetical protein
VLGKNSTALDDGEGSFFRLPAKRAIHDDLVCSDRGGRTSFPGGAGDETGRARFKMEMLSTDVTKIAHAHMKSTSESFIA